MPLKPVICIIILQFWLLASSAQTQSPLIFSRLTKSQGLVSNTVFQTARDQEGFLWIATQNGLQRYDGSRFLTFRHIAGDTTSLPKNPVSHIFIDHKNRLWVVFDNRAGIFDKKQFRFRAVKIEAAINNIRKILVDEKDNIILLADNKILRYDENSNRLILHSNLNNLTADFSINGFAVDKSSNENWFTGKKGSINYNFSTKKIRLRDSAVARLSVEDSFSAISNARYPFISAGGQRWMVNWIPFSGTAPLIYCYDKSTGKIKKFEKLKAYKTDSYYEVWNFFQQSNGLIWIYGMGLLAYYLPDENRFVLVNSNPFQSNGIEYDYVSHLYEDTENNVWVSTNNGLYRLNQSAQVFKNVPNKRLNDTGRLDKPISAIIETAEKNVWVSSFGNGIFSYDSLSRPVANPLTTANLANRFLYISYMTSLKSGQVCMGTREGELIIADGQRNSFRTIQPALLKGEKITQLLEDRSGNLWMGSGSGLLVKSKVSEIDDTANAYQEVLTGSADIMKLYEDEAGKVWVCTSTDGIYRIENNTNRILNHFTSGADDKKGLLNEGATDVLQYNDSIYLIASGSLCMLNIQTNQFNYLTVSDGFPAEQITSLIRDKNGRIWAMLDGGVYCLNVERNLYVSFDAADGIENDVFQVAAGRVLSDGRIAVGTTHDFAVFDPEKAMEDKAVPAVQIIGLVLGEKRLLLDSVERLSHLSLNYENTFLRLELSTLTFRDRYYMYYQFEGIDKAWKRINNDELTFQLLPPGDYVLMLKAQHGDGRESSKITRMKISVAPPFWQTWWFYGVMIILASAFLYWLDKRRINRKTAVLKMRSDIADELHKDINNTLGNITILSEMAKRKAEREPEKSREIIEEINRKSQQMLLAMDDILWSIDPENDSMNNFILRFREYIDALKSQYEVNIDLLVDKNAEAIPLEMKRRNGIFWLFKSGVTNVVRTGGKNCKIYISYERPHLVYTLEYDTLGMDTERMNVLRQRNELAEKLDALNATLKFKEYQSKAMFILSIPVKREGI